MTQAIDTQIVDHTDDLYIQTPVFILFAEYLGYPSKLIKMAEDWCDPDKKFPKQFIKTLLEREARTIYDSMLEELTEYEIHRLYKIFYQCGLDELEEDLKYKEELLKDDLPF